jgi:hypothetical protein
MPACPCVRTQAPPEEEAPGHGRWVQRRGIGAAIAAVARRSERARKVARGGEPADFLARRELARLGPGAAPTRITRGDQGC